MRAATSLRRIGPVSLAIAAAAAVLVAPPAAADDPYIPPLSCGVVHKEAGPITTLVHEGVEPLLRPIRLEYLLHDLNCSLLINTEYLLGLQTRPQFPF